jgi:hypothetical protein
MPPNTVVIDRTSEWGNPYKITASKHTGGATPGAVEYWVENPNINGVYIFKTRSEAQDAAVKLFRHWADHMAPMNYKDRARLALRGKNLACWCSPIHACHADVLLELANGATPESGKD